MKNLISSLVSLVSPPERQGQSLGVFQSSGSLARVTAPLMGGILFDRFFPAMPLLTGSVMALLAAAATFPVFSKVKISAGKVHS